MAASDANNTAFIPDPGPNANVSAGDVTPTVAPADILIVVLAHNEEARIRLCLNSLANRPAGADVHVVVNGTSDSTADLAREFEGVTVHEYVAGGKARSWNRFMLDSAPDGVGTYILVDGDAEVIPGSIAALVRDLGANPSANAAAALPRNGRSVQMYQDLIRQNHDMFGDLHALRGSFIDRMRDGGIRMPEDIIGDDSLIGALARTDLGPDTAWRKERIVVCEDAGFLCEPIGLSPAALHLQYKRMINYSVRHFQNRMVSAIMQGEGPTDLPPAMAQLYPEWLPRLTPRKSVPDWWFDRLALKRMAAAAGSFPKSR